MARYRADRYTVAFGPAVRVVGAISVEEIIYRQVPDFAMVGQCVVDMSMPIAFTAFFRLNQQVPQQSDPPLGMGGNCNKRSTRRS